jgi:CrcB protein
VRVDRRELAAIFVGGPIGALARYGLAEALPHHRGAWPWATFAGNIAGALLLGYLTTRLTWGAARTSA